MLFHPNHFNKELVQMFMTYQYFMAYQYRTFEPSKQEPPFDQFDLYFYKPKSAGVGVKARFAQKDRNLQFWSVDNLECKFINNRPQMEEGTETIQRWKKIVIPFKFAIYTQRHIVSHVNQFQTDLTTPLDQIIRKELTRLNKQLIKGLKQMPIKDKHLERNPQLKSWMTQDTPLEQIFVIQKSRTKNGHLEQGVVKVVGLYHQKEEEGSKLFKTVGFEAHKDQEMNKLLEKHGLKEEKNISYPTLIEMISIGHL